MHLTECEFVETDIGQFPADWQIVTLSELASFKTGPFGSRLHKSDYTFDGVPIINPMHIENGTLVPSKRMTVTVSEADTLKDYRLYEGDVIIGRRGEMGRCAVVRKKHEGWLCGTGSLIVRPNRGVDPCFLQRILASPAVVSRITDSSVGSTMLNLNHATLAGLKVQSPPLAEQRAIAEALSDVDALINAFDALITKKHHIKQGTMQQLLTGKKRLPGFSGEWEEVELESVAEFRKGKGLPKSAISPHGDEPCIHYGELFTHYPETISEIISHTNETDGCFRSIANDVLMPTSDVTPRGLAKASCVTVDGVILGGDILVIRTDTSRVQGSFLSYVIRSEENQVLQLVTGSTVFHLYGSDMKGFRCVLPPLDEQVAIAEVLSDMDAEITALEQKRDKTKLIKQGMMQELLTGKTRLVKI